MDSGSFPVASSLIRSSSLWFAAMHYCDLGLNPGVLTEPKLPTACEEYFAKDLGKKLLLVLQCP